MNFKWLRIFTESARKHFDLNSWRTSASLRSRIPSLDFIRKEVKWIYPFRSSRDSLNSFSSRAPAHSYHPGQRITSTGKQKTSRGRWWKASSLLSTLCFANFNFPIESSNRKLGFKIWYQETSATPQVRGSESHVTIPSNALNQLREIYKVNAIESHRLRLVLQRLLLPHADIVCNC